MLKLNILTIPIPLTMSDDKYVLKNGDIIQISDLMLFDISVPT